MNYLKEIGPCLVENGYHVCRIRPGTKAPLDKGWPDLDLTLEDCEKDKHENLGVGIICGTAKNPVVCLDADINDEEVSREFLRFLRANYGGMEIPVRYGKRPKFAALFKTAEPWRSDPSLKLEKRIGEEVVRVELDFRANGNQFVAYGIHPTTGKEYEWEGGDPSLWERDILTELSNGDKRIIAEKFREISQKHGYTVKSGKDSPDDEAVCLDDNAIYNLSKRQGRTIDEYREVLFACTLNPDDRNDWIKAGMAGHFEFEGSIEAFKVWDEWSQQSGKYKPGEPLKIWRGFKHDPVNPITFATLLRYLPENTGVALSVTSEELLIKALRLRFKGTLRRIPEINDRWANFNGLHWELVVEKRIRSKVFAAAKEIIDKELKEAQDKITKEKLLALKAKTHNNASAFIDRLIRRLGDESMAKISDFDTESRYLAVGNGDVDFETGELLPPDSSRLLSRSTPVFYVPDAECPLWEKTLLECLGGKEEVDYFRGLIGYAALGNPTKNLVVFLHGNGCNGKSTVMGVIKEVLGEHYRPTDSETFMRRRQVSAVTVGAALLDIRGARIIEASETGNGDKINEALLKRLTGGDEVSVRAPYGSAQEVFSLIGTLFIATNYLPNIEGTDNGIWRRVKLVGFPRDFDHDPTFKKNENLREDLLKEKEGILAWVVKAAMEYQANGLKETKKVTAAIRDYRSENDIVGQFMSCYVTVKPGARIKAGDLYNAFTQYTDSVNDNGGIKTQRGFTTEVLKRIEVIPGVQCKKSNGAKVFYGLEVREPSLDANDEFADESF